MGQNKTGLQNPLKSKMTELEIRKLLDSVKIEPRDPSLNLGICCDFSVGSDSYYADIATGLPWIGTECMIFEKVGDEIQWDGLYCRRDIPFSEAALKECIIEFIRTKYVD
jgi:hypothetical protein